MSFHEREFRSPVLQLEEVDSTNAEALRRAAAGERGPLWIAAARQTAGRGRSGRTWAQADGNLAASFLFVPDGQIGHLHQLSLLAGVAVHDAITAAGGAVAGLRLKWPNDILIDRAKTGGILVETTNWDGATVAVIGIGLNIATAPAVDGRAVARLGDHAAELTSDAMLPALDVAMRRWLADWQGGQNFASVREAWLARCDAAGETLTVNAGAERVDGRFDGIDGSGALLLRLADGRLRRLTYGDVSFGCATEPPPKGPKE